MNKPTRTPLSHGGTISKSRRDALALEQIGQVDMDKIEAVNAGRLDNINAAMELLEELAEGDKLTMWEYDFWESLNNWQIEGKKLSDKQYEKLLQIQIKYE